MSGQPLNQPLSQADITNLVGDLQAIRATLLALQTPVIPGHGYYYQGQNIQSASATLGNGSLRTCPVLIPVGCRIQGLFAEFTVAGDAASKFAPAMYADNGSFYPGAKVVTGKTISTGTGNAGDVSTGGTPGVYYGALAAEVAIPAGLYHIGGVVQGVTVTQPTIRTGFFMNYPGPSTTVPGTNSTLNGALQSSVTGALPDPWAGTSFSGSSPRVGFRVA